MPVSTDCAQPPAKRCKYCDESTHGVDGPLLWRLTLDQDLLDTLTRRFPSWFNSTQQSSDSGFVSASDKYFSVNLTDLNGMAEGDNSLVNSTAPSERPLLGVEENIVNGPLTNVMNARQSPPKAVVDSSPLQPAMDKNKESLKVKLMVRRPINQLVEQGIIPPLKTSPALHEQRKQLERAKTGDLLRAKIQQRPDRQELERRHILEHDESHVDPSLAEKQRMLKKARLADQLNSQISHRPGPLELIKKNILHTEEPIERIVKEGLVSFKATSEGLLNRPQQPNAYITYEDDSQSSEGDQRNTPPRTDVIEAAAASAGIVTVALTIPTTGGAVVVTSAPVLQTKFHPALVSTPYVPPPPPPPPVPIIKSEPIQIKSETSNLFAELCQSVVGNTSNLLPLVPSPVSLSSTTSTLSPLSSIASPPSGIINRQIQSPHPSQSHKSDAPGKDKNRKKSTKTKPVTKARTIKFHEYKGPPSAQKSSSSSSSVSEETSYQLLLKQQTFLLEYLEGLNKHPTILPANQKPQSDCNSFQQNSNSYMIQPMPSPAPSICSSIPASPAPSFTDSVSSELGKLEKMKVSDLKVLLKKRNLPVSGPKPQLIERLKPFLPLEAGDTSTSESISGETCDMETMNSPHHSLSPESEHESMEVQQIDSPAPVDKTGIHHQHNNDDLLREQQRKIDDLQRKLRESQEQLLHMRQHHIVVPAPPPPQPILVAADPPKPPEVINQKLVFKQQLEAKIQKEKLQQLENQRLQREHLAFQQAKNQGNILLRNQSPVLIAPKEDKNIQLAFKNNPTTSLGNKKNVEILWNGEPTLLLVGLQDNKRIINGVQQNTTSMPGILVPISAAPPPPPLPPMTAIINKVGLHSQPTRIPQVQIQTHVQAAPPQMPPLQPTTQIAHPTLHPIKIEVKPPPQYEEATKQIETRKEGKSNVKSQVMTDVLEILIKNGELPETAVFDPTTPTTQSQSNLAPNLVYNEAKMPLSESVPSKLMLSSAQNIQNVEMLSPIQPDCDNSVNSFDMFLEQHGHNNEDTHQNGQQTTQQHQPSQAGHETPSHLSTSHDDSVDLKPFDDLELMELMGHHLDMDIGDDSCNQYHQSSNNNLVKPMANCHQSKSNRRDMNPSLQPSLNDLIEQQQHNLHDTILSNGFNNNYSNITSSNHNTNNNNNNIHFNSTPMDIEDFENSLSSFDFSALTGVQDEQINTPPHPFSQHHQQHQQNQSAQMSHNGIDSDSNCYDPPLAINHDSILDIFNIDDFKMANDTLSWNEVDYAV